MATLSMQIPDELMRLAEARAEAIGFADVREYVAQLIVGEAAGAPEGLAVDSDEGLESLLSSRLDGPFVDFDAADIQRMRESFRVRLEASDQRP